MAAVTNPQSVGDTIAIIAGRWYNPKSTPTMPRSYAGKWVMADD
jgi:hypothetical protein